MDQWRKETPAISLRINFRFIIVLNAKLALGKTKRQVASGKPNCHIFDGILGNPIGVTSFKACIMNHMKVVISSDHGGWEMKKYLVEKLSGDGIEVTDLGPQNLDANDDYPETVAQAIETVQESNTVLGILICRNGVGVNIVANKTTGIRAGLSWTVPHAISHRRDDHTNILTLPADYITKETALAIASAWLSTEPSKEPRHLRRLRKLEKRGNR